MSGAVSYQRGLAAEDSALRHYQAAGAHLLARRWRGAGGEIDLILQDDAQLIFVEVKSSTNFDTAAFALRPAQIARIYASAEDYMAANPSDQPQFARLDVALVDGAGRVKLIENAIGGI